MTREPRIGECDACHARFKIPESFRADRARCRECGGVVLIASTQPVPRPALERRRSSPQDRAARQRTGATESRAPTSDGTRPDQRDETKRNESPAQRAAPPPQPEAPRAPAAKPAIKSEPPTPPNTKKPAGVLGSIVAAAKAAVWRKKRGKASSGDEPAAS